MRNRFPSIALLVTANLMLLATALSAQTIKSSRPISCIPCHLEVGDEIAAPVHAMETDVHTSEGISCVECHGGDPDPDLAEDIDLAMDPARGYTGVPKRQEIPGFCGKCHSDPEYMRKYNPRAQTDQLALYLTSTHGKELRAGDAAVAVCTDCHGAHGVLPASDSRSSTHALNIPETCGRCHSDRDYMDPYPLPTDQVASFESSVHGTALLERGETSAPACNDCHGNHGAAPPTVTSIRFVCGQCHLNNSELFQKSPHQAPFAEEELPECESCHGYHDIQPPTDSMLGTGPEGICTDCHGEDSEGARTGAGLFTSVQKLGRKIARADSLSNIAERAGMEIAEARFLIADARQSLIQSRTLIHSFSLPTVQESTTAGEAHADSAYQISVEALDELQFRRKGLGLSLIFILILAVGIYLKIRELDARPRTAPHG